MSFLNPAAFLFLLGIPAVILLHFLKRRRLAVTVSSTLLWTDSVRDQRTTAPFRRIRPSLLLLLQILIILLLALALARPVRTVPVAGFARTVYLLDVTASMQAVEGNGARFATAQAALQTSLERLGHGQQAMLIAAGRQARVVVPFTDDRQALLKGLASLDAQAVPGRLEDALRLAATNLQLPGGPAAVEVYTDGAFPAPPVPDLGGAALHWHQVGTATENVGITAFEARKTLYGTGQYQAFVSVTNFGERAQAFPLHLTLGQRSLQTERVTLAPGTTRALVVPFGTQTGGVLEADLGLTGPLAADKHAWVILPRPRPRQVLYIGPGNAFLEKALAADPEVRMTRGRLETLPQAAPPADVIILDGVPTTRVPPGRYLFLHTVPGNVPLQVLGHTATPAVLDWDRTHPVMRYLDLSKVLIQDALRVRPLGSARSLIDSQLTSLAYALDDGSFKAVYLGFDLTHTDFPLRVAFPLFVSNTLRWLAPTSLEDAGLQKKTGEPLIALLPPGARDATLTDPAGAPHALVSDASGRVHFADTTQVGVYTLRAGSWEQRFGVNLLDETESNLRPQTTALSAPGTLGDAREGQATFPSQQELWKLCALVALGLLIGEGLLAWKERGSRWPWALGARLAVLLAVLGALAGWTVSRATDLQTVLFLLDASDSVSLENRLKARQYVAEAVKAAGPHDRYGVITFGGSSVIETPVGREPLPTKPPITADSRTTDIGAAIQLAVAAFPREGARRIVLLTDGNENQGDARDAARAAGQAGVAIDVVPLRTDYPHEVVVQQLVAPAEVKFGESFLVRVVAWSAGETKGRVSLYRDGDFVGSQPVIFTAGKNVFAYQQAIAQGGFHVYQVRVEAPDQVLEENKRGIAVVAVRGKPQLLYVEQDRDQAAHLLNALRAQNFAVEIVGPDGVPSTPEGLGKYDSVILSNVAALRLGNAKMETLRRYVRDQGGGLVMLGGDQSFGVGGYYQTPIEEALPVTMEARQKVTVPSLAMVMIIDRSGSMDETTGESKAVKIELAKEAASLVVEQLDPKNEVGVLAFDTEFSWVVPIQPAKNKDAILQQIATIKAGGGTTLFPPLKEAYEAIYDRDAVLRHVLVLTDGEVETADFDGLVRRMQKDKITVSTVAVGDDADLKFLTNMARQGHGRFYYTNDAANVPRILAQETQLASKASLIEQAFRPRLADPSHEIVQGIPWDQAPPLGGYDAVLPKPSADVLLVSHQSDPVLAAWRYGLGRSVAFTSDAKAKWGVLWLKWPGYSQLFGQLLRWTLRTTPPQQVTTTVTADDGRGAVTLEAVDAQGEFINFLDAHAGLVQPDKQQRVVPLVQIGPGRYRGRFGAADEGAYLLGISERKGGQRFGSEVASVVVPYSPELRALAVNDALLADLTGLTGGATPAAPGDAFTARRHSARIPVDAWPYLLMLTQALFLADVALRRFLPRLAGRPGHGLPTRATTASAPHAMRFGRSGRR
jgi:Ca-activated chloride channel homolog